MPESTTIETKSSLTELKECFLRIRAFSERLCEPLEAEDFVVQSMPDVSPTRWHLAHTTWFFETFVLAKSIESYRPVNKAFEYLFNSYYNTVGEQFPRARRGLLTRPTVSEVFEYRRAVDSRVLELLDTFDYVSDESVRRVVELGLHHEQQHQELMLTDIKHVLSCNPLFPVYRSAEDDLSTPASQLTWIDYPGGVVQIGHDGQGFAYDNEGPRHETLLRPYQLSSRPITCGEYQQFIEDGGYDRPELWLSLGWTSVQDNQWSAPLYWHRDQNDWQQFTLNGQRPIDPHEPVCHISFFEADAYARWAGSRLPTEVEWESASANNEIEGNFADSERFHPRQTPDVSDVANGMFGDIWQWTASPYLAYPGYVPAAGALGEYNGKFMCNQFVLRGGSCATSQSHIRPTYRNFFPPDARWQFSGFRLAR